jgi:L-threonylcarbamoyladenylate synthase
MQLYTNLNELNIKPTDVFLHFTGNIFGIGCSAFNEEAIEKIIQLKYRDASKGFITLFASLEQASRYQLSQLTNPKIDSLLRHFYPGNMTAILHTADDRFNKVWLNNKIGIRIPTSKLLRDFIESTGNPIVSTSINVSGNPFCTDIDVIKRDFHDWFDWGLYDVNEPADKPLPSTVIDFEEETGLQIKCLREGSIPFSTIEAYWATL